jgi:pteridine reductase
VNVIVHYYQSRREAENTLTAIQALGVEGRLVQGDLSQVEQAERVVDEALAVWGQLDILVNNAAIFERTPLGTVTEAQWDALLNTNLKGPFFCAQRAGLAMRESGSGVIINLIDTGVYLAWAGYIPYLISKAGVEQMTYGLAKALAPQVRVNGIAPGPILPEAGSTVEEREQAVNRTLLKRLGGEQVIAEAVLYLAQAEFITGVVLPVDGGQRWK